MSHARRAGRLIAMYLDSIHTVYTVCIPYTLYIQYSLYIPYILYIPYTLYIPVWLSHVTHATCRSAPRYVLHTIYTVYTVYTVDTVYTVYPVHLSDTRTGWQGLIGRLKLQVVFRKRATTIGLFCGTWPGEIRHPMTLRQPCMTESCHTFDVLVGSLLCIYIPYTLYIPYIPYIAYTL